MPAEHRKGRRRDRLYTLHAQTMEVFRSTLPSPRRRVFPFPYKHRQIWSHLKRILDAAGLPSDKKHMYHCLRRSAESYAAAERGAQWAADAVGHAVEVARRSYISPLIARGRSWSALPVRPSARTARRNSSSSRPGIGDWGLGIRVFFLPAFSSVPVGYAVGRYEIHNLEVAGLNPAPTTLSLMTWDFTGRPCGRSAAREPRRPNAGRFVGRPACGCGAVEFASQRRGGAGRLFLDRVFRGTGRGDLRLPRAARRRRRGRLFSTSPR